MSQLAPGGCPRTDAAGRRVEILCVLLTGCQATSPVLDRLLLMDGLTYLLDLGRQVHHGSSTRLQLHTKFANRPAASRRSVYPLGHLMHAASSIMRRPMLGRGEVPVSVDSRELRIWPISGPPLSHSSEEE